MQNDELKRQREEKLGRPLTEEEHRASRTVPRETLRREMPAIARRLEAFYLGVLRSWWPLIRVNREYDQERSLSEVPVPKAKVMPLWLDVMGVAFVFLMLVSSMVIPLIFEKLDYYSMFIPMWLGALIGSVDYVLYSRLENSRLENSNILEKLIAGELDVNEIVRRTPTPWREIFMRSGGGDLHSNALLVAWNLDWYVRPTRFHFRLTWLVYLLLLIIVVLNLADDPNSYALTWYSLGGAIPLVVFHFQYERSRIRFFAAALVRKLRRDYGQPDVEES